MTDINRIIVGCVELLEVKIIKQHVDCRLELDDKLPQVQADKGKLEQVLINLLLNALESVEMYGRIVVTTRADCLENGDYVTIRVEDDGKGISKEMTSRIYEPFYTTKTTGTGLGLANVKRIAAAHKGRINVVGLKPSGTAFEVSLPLEKGCT